MNTKIKSTLALSVVLAALLPLTTSLNPFTPQFYASRMDKLESEVPVMGPVIPDPLLGPIYDNNMEQQQEAAPAVAATQSAPASKKIAATSSKTVSRSSGNVIGNSPVIGAYTQDDLYWLAKMVYAEAAAESYNGQVAVAAVILHRVASPTYPNTVKGVLFQVVDGHYQFTPIQNGYINQVEPNATAYRAAKDALAGVDPSRGAMLYYNPKTSTNKWILSRQITVVIGNHTFAK